MLFTIILAYLIGFAEILSFILSICQLVNIKKQKKKESNRRGGVAKKPKGNGISPEG